MKNMKKVLKTVTVFTLGMILATSTLYASGYINWKGTPEVENTMANLDGLNSRINELKTLAEDRERQVKDLTDNAANHESELIERDNILEKGREAYEELKDINIGLNKEIEKLDKEIAELTEKLNKSAASTAEHEQAYKDVKMIDARVIEILENAK